MASSLDGTSGSGLKVYTKCTSVYTQFDHIFEAREKMGKKRRLSGEEHSMSSRSFFAEKLGLGKTRKSRLNDALFNTPGD